MIRNSDLIIAKTMKDIIAGLNKILQNKHKNSFKRITAFSISRSQYIIKSEKQPSALVKKQESSSVSYINTLYTYPEKYKQQIQTTHTGLIVLMREKDKTNNPPPNNLNSFHSFSSSIIAVPKRLVASARFYLDIKCKIKYLQMKCKRLYLIFRK